MATASARAHLERLSGTVRTEPSDRGIVLTTPEGQRHEIGILACAVVGGPEVAARQKDLGRRDVEWIRNVRRIRELIAEN